jgi:hypothetical protein
MAPGRAVTQASWAAAAHKRASFASSPHCARIGGAKLREDENERRESTTKKTTTQQKRKQKKKKTRGERRVARPRTSSDLVIPWEIISGQVLILCEQTHENRFCTG